MHGYLAEAYICASVALSAAVQGVHASHLNKQKLIIHKNEYEKNADI